MTPARTAERPPEPTFPADRETTAAAISPSALLACEHCDAVQAKPRAGRARCQRCGAALGRRPGGQQEAALALALAGIPALVLAGSLPLLEMRGAGAPVQATLLAATRALAGQQLPSLAALVLVTALLLPALRLLAVVHVLAFHRLGRRAPGLRQVLAFLSSSQPWAASEILLLGALVALVKLAGMFAVVPGPGLVALGALVLLELGASRLLDRGQLWAGT